MGLRRVSSEALPVEDFLATQSIRVFDVPPDAPLLFATDVRRYMNARRSIGSLDNRPHNAPLVTHRLIKRAIHVCVLVPERERIGSSDLPRLGAGLPKLFFCDAITRLNGLQPFGSRGSQHLVARDSVSTDLRFLNLEKES